MVQAQLQLGKAGLTESFLKNINIYFEKYKDVKISVLQSADRKSMKEYSEKILDNLGKNYTARIIGFTIALKKWRKDMR